MHIYLWFNWFVILPYGESVDLRSVPRDSSRVEWHFLGLADNIEQLYYSQSMLSARPSTRAYCSSDVLSTQCFISAVGTDLSAAPAALNYLQVLV